MNSGGAHHAVGGGGRHIGTVGTAARAVLGVIMVGSVVVGHVRGDFDPAPFVLGLALFPAVVLVWQRRWARRHPERLVITGPLGYPLTVAVFSALYFTWWYAPSVSALSDAALLFYGTSMLAAAVKGYGGCEVLAISNWVLGRDDQVGCLLLEPVDRAERQPRRGGDSHERPEAASGTRMEPGHAP